MDGDLGIACLSCVSNISMKVRAFVLFVPLILVADDYLDRHNIPTILAMQKNISYNAQ